MKPVAALVAITVLTLAGLLSTGPFTGSAGAAPVVAAPAADTSGGPLRLSLTEVSPRVVTADGPGTLTVTGTLTNTGAEPVDDLMVRVQRGDPLTTEGALRDALDGGAGTEAVTPQFGSLSGELAPGGQLPIRLSVALRGPPETSLALASTGVHELLVNVNGAPLDGATARLAAVRVLLPVLSLPPDRTLPRSTFPISPGAGTEAVPFSLLYPIADTPRRLSTVPGETALLTDDGLAASFAPGGRLGGLVAALADVAPVGSRVRDATCLAIDPDLVETAAAMSTGYQVRGPDDVPVPGAGAEEAGRWLDSLIAVARDGCVIALPYADADLVALTRGGLGELATAAVTDGRQVLADLLATPVVPGVTWPADGFIDEPTRDRVAAADGRSLLLSADGLNQGSTRRDTGVLAVAGGDQPQFAVLTDPLLTLAATGPGPPAGPATDGGAAVVASTAAGSDSPLSTQDTIGALVFRLMDTVTSRADGPLVLAPPHQWAAEATGARALLAAVDQLLDSGRIASRALDALLGTGPDGGSRAAVYPEGAGAREVPGAVVDVVGRTSDDITDLRSAAVEGSGVGVEPDVAFTLLRRGLLRPVSAAWRGQEQAAARAADLGADRIDDLRATVRVLEPPSPYSLGTSDAPILITVANGLPFTVEVRVEIAPSAGLRVAPIATQQVPPLGRRQVSAGAKVARSGQFTVEAAVRTPDGELLGPPSRLRVRSTAYGTITVWLTGSAGVLLVVLAARRVVRRIRGEPGQHAGPGHLATDPAATDPRSDSPEQPVPAAPSPRRPRPRPGPVPRPAPRGGDPFPDPLGPTDRLPVPRPRPDDRPRPPGPPPRVSSP